MANGLPSKSMVNTSAANKYSHQLSNPSNSNPTAVIMNAYTAGSINQSVGFIESILPKN
jgi:hypothetical protein